MTSEEWNTKYPVGTSVRYFPVLGEQEFLDTQTRSEAWDLDCGVGVVLLRGKSGGMALSHVFALEAQ